MSLSLIYYFHVLNCGKIIIFCLCDWRQKTRTFVLFYRCSVMILNILMSSNVKYEKYYLGISCSISPPLLALCNIHGYNYLGLIVKRSRLFPHHFHFHSLREILNCSCLQLPYFEIICLHSVLLDLSVLGITY